MRASISTFVDPMFGQNAYVLVSGRSSWVIDPGLQTAEIMDHLSQLATQGVTLERIVNTHGHADHIAGNGELKQAYPQALLCAPKGELNLLVDADANLSAGFGIPVISPPADVAIEPGDTLYLGELSFDALDVAGHSPAGLAFYCAQEKLVISGDALFAGGIGRSDLPGSNPAKLDRNIRQSLYSLPDDTRVLSGHGPATTIGTEKRTNPFVRG